MGNVFFKAQEDLPRRVIRPLDEHTAMAYSDNTVTNSRYTFYSFLPVNLYEQFRRPINFYFLLVTALQFIPVIAPVNPLSTLVPLVFAFSLTAIKEGYDDVKRHRQDEAYNSKYRCVLDRSTKEWQYKHNSSIRVGDVVMIGQNEELPCDMIVVAASGKQTVYVRTDNLDGEIDLKQRDVVAPPRPTTTSPNVVSSVDVPLAVTDTVEEMLEKLSRLTLHCPPPSSIIEAFDGRADFVGHAQDPATLEPTLHMEQTTTEVSMTFRHLLPQSSYLKNTERALAIAVYTGNDTKCGMNKRAPPRKWAKIDRHISRYSMFIFCAQLICAAIFGLTGFLSNRNLPERAWYLPQPTHEPPAFLVYPLRFFLLTTAMIPISFKFIVDMSKYYMSMMVEWDASMMHGAEREGCKVKNSSILEDLGQIDYVLSDKTGTMTQNVMELMYLYVAEVEQEIHLGAIATPPSIAGSPTYACEAFTDAVEEEPIAVDAMVFSNIPQVMEMATALALCNNVEVVHTISTNTVSFQATSPDETALCCGAAKLNAVLYQRTETEAVVKVNDVERRWRIHVVFPFSSEKKSMGMLAEDEQSGRIYFLVKGADDRILSMVAPKTQGRDDGVWLSRLSDQLSTYACTGLRTLLVASKEISRSSLNEFLDKYTAASTLLDGRQEKLDELRLSMETNVRVLGITAIEDKLQDGVQETVCSLQEAGIKLWMLTGDKVETAEQIGLCCKLYAPGDRIIRVVEMDPHSNNSNSNNTRRWDEELMEMDINAMFPPQTKMTFSKQWLGSIGGTMQQKVLHYSPDTPDDVSTVSADMPTVVESPEGGRPTRSVLIVQGGAVLHSILTIPALRQKFAELSYHCNSVICARTTPSQKAAITTLVRSSGHVVLSIGDGGNDVAMLQEAEVGVGIAGKEGKQAARAADFVVSQFSDLRPLLLVHGQQSYVRTAYVIKYSFYKSMLIAMLQLVFNLFYTHISGASFWNSYSLMMWNGVYTLPQTFLYCLDRCAPRVVLERTPSLYKLTRAGMDLMWSEFFGSYLARGVIQSSLLLWLTMKCLGPTFSLAHHGWAETNDVAFTIAYTSLIFSQLFTLLWESHSITIWNLFFLVGMPVFYLVATLAYSSIPALDYYGVFAKTLHVEMWVIVITITAVLLVPFLVLFGLRNAKWPNCRDLLSAAEVQRQQRLLKQRGYRKEQSWFVRAPLGMTPEAISSFVDKGNILGVAGDALSMVSYGITGAEV